MVVSVHMLNGGSDPAGYYLSRQTNCPADYYLGAEPTGRWLGAGAEPPASTDGSTPPAPGCCATSWPANRRAGCPRR